MKRTNKQQTKTHIKKGDIVLAIAGNDRGRTGEVYKVLPKERRVLVKGMRIVTCHLKRTQKGPGRIIRKELSVHISNLMVVEPETQKATRIGRRMNKTGKLQRYSKKTKHFI
ncbi:MAG: 50S ribosomal protein L24 [Bacteroidota bacterium]